MKNLYINSCARNDSRTNLLSRYLLEKLQGEFLEINLEKENISPLTKDLLEKRETLIALGEYNHPMFYYANLFVQAENIVIGAPYWDLSFPSSLKCFIELVNIVGLTFSYSKEGAPIGLCKAKNLFYVTTSGGAIISDDYGFGYIKALATTLYGIKNIHYFKSENLDIVGSNVDEILTSTKNAIDNFFAQ